MSKAVIWLDDQLDTADTLIAAANGFESSLTKLGIKLVQCGGGTGTKRERGRRCLQSFHEVLTTDQSIDIIGFVLDVMIPGKLESLGNQYVNTKTAGGSDAGYQIGRQYLRNMSGSIQSPHGDKFQTTPILFFSVSDRCISNFSAWTFEDPYVAYMAKNVELDLQLMNWVSEIT